MGLKVSYRDERNGSTVMKTEGLNVCLVSMVALAVEVMSSKIYASHECSAHSPCFLLCNKTRQFVIFIDLCYLQRETEIYLVY